MTFNLRHLCSPTAAICIAAATLVAPAAQAGPGDHIQLGTSTEIAPDIDLGFQYRSNVTQSPDDPLGGLNLTVAPGARVSYLTPDTEFNLVGDYRLVKYFTRVLAQADQFNDFDVSADGVFAKTRPVGFVIHERASLVNNNADRLGNTPFHTRFRNELAGGLQIRPGAVVQIDLAGNFEFDNFRVPVGAQAGDARDFNSRIGGGGTWQGQWRFLPRTAVVVEGDLTRYQWTENWIPEGDRGTFLAMPDSTHFRILGGLRGRLTDRVVIATELGYGSANYSETSVTNACFQGAECDPTNAANPFGDGLKGLERLLVVAQVQYEMDEDRTITVGYRKDFDDVFFTNYMAYNRVYTSLASTFGTRVSTDVSLALRQESYRGEKFRNDVFLDLQGDVSYSLQEWARITGGVGYQQRVSPSDNAVSYSDVQPRLLMTFSY